jgi:hypothetical protein
VSGGTTSGNAGRTESPSVARSGTGGTGTVTSGSTVSNQRTRADAHSGYNPYVPTRSRDDRHARNGNYGVVYGNPFYPFSYGFNPGWYGSGYGSYYNNYPYNGYSFGDGLGTTTGDYNTNYQTSSSDGATSSAQVPQTPPTVTAGTSSVTAQAITANAVEKSPALVSANGAVTQAQGQYNEARDRVLATLRDQPAYQQALDRRRQAAAQVAAAKSTAPAAPNAQPSGTVVAAATAKLDAGDEVTKMEEQAVAKDPAAIAAKARLDQAIADRDALKAQLTAQFQQSSHGG